MYYNIFIILPNNATDNLIYYYLFLRRKQTFIHKSRKVTMEGQGSLDLASKAIYIPVNIVA